MVVWYAAELTERVSNHRASMQQRAWRSMQRKPSAKMDGCTNCRDGQGRVADVVRAIAGSVQEGGLRLCVCGEIGFGRLEPLMGPGHGARDRGRQHQQQAPALPPLQAQARARQSPARPARRPARPEHTQHAPPGHAPPIHDLVRLGSHQIKQPTQPALAVSVKYQPARPRSNVKRKGLNTVCPRQEISVLTVVGGLPL